MVIKSRFSFPIPQASLPSFVFDSPTAGLPTTPALISSKEPDKHFISLSDYRLYAQRLASGLLRSGVEPGDRVLLFSGNTLFFPSVFMGVIMAGAIFTGANPTYVARELAHQLTDSGAKYLICAEGSLDTGLAAAKEAGLLADQIFIFDDGVATLERGAVTQDTPNGKVRHWTTLLDSEERGRAYHWPNLQTDEELDRVVALNYSSGTTGVAKGVMITHKNYVANCAQQIFWAHQLRDIANIRKRQRMLCFLPMYHAYAQTLFCVNAMKERVPVYLMQKFDFLEMLHCIERFRITDLSLVPPVIVAMAKHPAARRADLSSVERVGSGAAPLGHEVCVEFEKLFPPGRVNVKQGWGMTEATCSALTFHPEKRSASFSVGEPMPNVAARIMVDEEGRVEAGKGERGELWIKGPNVMRGYWGKAEATSETLTEDGWLKTGDICYVDDEGHFFIVDRKKELIKVKGLQVAPAELEALLLDHPDVQDAAVIGIPCDGSELPRAYVVPSRQDRATAKVAEHIKTWLAERVSRAKRLDGGVHFIDAIPKNPSGKIMRRRLRELAAAEPSRAKL